MVVQSGEEKSIKAHFGKESCVGVRVAKWIDLPPDSWFHAEFPNDEVVTDHHVVDHIVVNRACLIMHGPSSIDELELPVLYKLSYLILFLVVLKIPPHGKELHLDFGELSLWVVQ